MIALALLNLCVAAARSTDGGVPIHIHTSLGDIDAVLDEAHAPGTVANFLKRVDAHEYDNTSFYRTVTTSPDNQPGNAAKIDVIQGGIVQTGRGPNVALERTKDTGLHHHDGTLSMARSMAADSASSEIFICVGDHNEALDFGGGRIADGQGFAAFGQVTHGMDVVQKIHDAPNAKQSLTPPVKIESIELDGAPSGKKKCGCGESPALGLLALGALLLRRRVSRPSP